MVFGKTKISSEEAARQWRVWHRVYSWLPVQLIDGRWAWFEPVDRISYYAREIDSGAPNSFFGWCYRLPLGEEA